MYRVRKPPDFRTTQRDKACLAVSVKIDSSSITLQ
jgi:hypothetical protein